MRDLILTKEKVWLVKSSSKILGPFFHSEIIQSLQSKRISILDEVKSHNSRWTYIRENPYFEDIVKTLRFNQDDSADKTSMTKTGTMGMTVTMTTTEQNAGTITQSIHDPIDGLTPTPVFSDTLNIKDVKPISDINVGSSPNASLVKKFGSLADQKVQSQVERKSNFFLYLVIVFFLVVSAGLFFTNIRNSKNKDRTYDYLIQTSERLNNLGLYEKALSAFNQATQIKKTNLNDLARMAPVKMLLEKDTVVSRKIIEDYVNNKQFELIKEVDALTYLAKSYFYEGKVAKAEELFTKAHNQDFNSPYTTINYLTVGLYTGNLNGEDFKTRDFPAEVQPLRFVVFSQDQKMNFSEQAILKEQWQNSLSARAFFREEQFIYLLKSFINDDPNQSSQLLESFFKEWLVINPGYIKNLKVLWAPLEWENLIGLCEKNLEKTKTQTLSKLMLTLCYMRSEQPAKAQSLLAELAKTDAQNNYLKLMYAYSFYKLGSSNDALTYINNMTDKQFTSAVLLKGYICLQKQDYECAHSEFARVLNQKSDNFEALYGEALAYFKENNLESSRLYLNKAIDVESKISNAIELREQLESGD